MADETSLSLIRRVQSNSQEGWSRLVELYAPLIQRWLRRAGVGRDDLDDIAQDVLATIAREVNRFEHSGRTGAWRAWLRQITVNRTRQHWGRRKVAAGQEHSTNFLDQLDDPSSELSIEWDQEHDRHVVAQLLKLVEVEFQPSTRSVFRRTFIDEASPNEVANELGMSLAAVYTAKSRVLAFLRKEAEGIIDLEDEAPNRL
jgi:RNA polymerase sigma factor (sigma-70 family)